MPNFTLDQKKAHDATRHISITANAGSGKTRVLVSRYCDILENQNVWPEDLAAITFTEKAASELRAKIAQELESRLGDVEHQRHWTRLRDVRERFTSAVVTTIHGFCSQMLREFPIEANVQPNYSVLSGYERKKAQEDALMEAIESALREPESGTDRFSPAYKVARRIGREKMEEIVRSMMGNREMIDYSERHGVLALGREETLERWRKMIDESVRATLLAPEVRAAARELIDQMKEEKATEAIEAFAAVRRARDAGEIIEGMNTLRKLLLTTTGTPRIASYQIAKEDLEILMPHCSVMNDAFERAKPFLEISLDPAVHQTLFDDAHVLLDLYHETNNRYASRKLRMNALDFEDLQLLLLRALEDPEGHARIAGRFRYLMVDEFQDTNRVQYAIAFQILKRLNAGNLCVVGDPKQSIYGFRNAEVEVFHEANENITRSNREHGVIGNPLVFRNELLLSDSPEEALGLIKLDASFRLLPSICAYVNAACGPLMDTAGGTFFAIDYEPLVCARHSDGRGRIEVMVAREDRGQRTEEGGRRTEDGGQRTEESERIGESGNRRSGESADRGDEQSIINHEQSTISQPTTDYGQLTTDSSPIENPKSKIENRCDPLWCPEAEMIARRLLGIVREAEPVVWEMGASGNERDRNTSLQSTTNNQQPTREHSRAAHFSDMAILCRKRTHFPALEAAFRKYGVPFVTYGGVGFYRTQEIYDLVNYLRTLLNSRDDIALLGVLRSPFFCVSDAELYRLGQMETDGGQTDLWSRALRWGTSANVEPALRRAIDIISDDRSMASRIPVSLLIRRAIERTGWRGATIGTERGEQNLANADKLLEMARDFEERGFTNLFDFVERITDLIELEELESEAPINTGRDAVRLMTMHAAKGLEFPIVVLPSLHSKAGSPSRFYFDKELGYGWNWSFNKEDFRPGVVALMSLRETLKDRAEEARLFYVASTRARDLLILSGEYDHENPPKDTMLNWALAPFIEIPEENVLLPLVSESLRFLNPDGATERTEQWEQLVAFHLDIGDLPRYAPFSGEKLPFRAELVMIGELPARAEGEIYSASQLLVYSQCPTKYYLKYRLGIPEDLEMAYEVDSNTRDSEDGTLFARLFRMTAVRIDEMEGRNGEGARVRGWEGANKDERADDPVVQNELVSVMPIGGSAEDILQAIERTPRTIVEVVDETLRLEPLTAAQLAVVRPRLIETFRRIFASDAARASLFPTGATASVEQELRMPFDHEYVMGVMDRMLVADDGTISILHYKTLRLERDAVPRTAESYLPQLRLYAYLASALNPTQRSVRATVLFTEHPDNPQGFTFTKFDMMRIEEEVRAAIADIRQISYTGRRELPLKSPHCPLCSYWIEGECLLGRSGR